MPLAPDWQPTRIRRFIESLGTSTRVMRVETDLGEGFVKALGNPEGPHVLASEWVGSQLAALLGLPTLDFAIIRIDPDVELPMAQAGNAAPGPAFISRLDNGLSWGGAADLLETVANKEAMSGLVVLDTWIRNRDRFCPGSPPRRNPDNVWLSRTGQRGRRTLLTAIDHTHCFGDGTHLTTALASISTVRDDRIFGLFPEFEPYLDVDAFRRTSARLASVTKAQLEPMIDSIPGEWELPQNIRMAWLEMLTRRASYVADTLVSKVFPGT